MSHVEVGNVVDMVRESVQRDPAISGFVREKISEWRKSGRELQELARIAGIAKSMPSQVLRGLGVGGRSVPGFAKAFGFASVETMTNAAYEWWIRQGKAGALAVDDPPTQALAEATSYVLGLNQATPEHLKTILARYSHPDFLARDREWWTETLLREVRIDRTAIESDARLRKEIGATQAGVRAQQRAIAEQKAHPEKVRQETVLIAVPRKISRSR